MFPRSFDYSAPKTLTEALELLKNADSKVKVLAGGQSLIPALKTRSSPLISSLKSVVDINGVKELNYIRKVNETLKIGALTTVSVLENDLDVASSFPILHEAASEIADPLVRNLGTVGGNLCHGDPVNDLPATMIALNASVVLASMGGNRKANVEDLYISPYKTSIRPNEILTEIQIPIRAGRRGNAYRKIKKGSGGFTIAGVAADLSVEEDNSISACRLALTGVGSKTLRPREAEQTLVGKRLESPFLKGAAKLAVEASHPVSDLYASAEYRRKILGMLVKDSLESAYKRAAMGNYEKS
ncbi:MAG: xanthine dehydrogenase family protein subunit M [Candidatus Bathyarchaeia archaeon]|jgi:carbon-monoxide dehydrogenase medium subunit